MDIHAVEAEALWKGAGGKPADLKDLRERFAPGMSFAELASRRDLADMDALRSFGSGGVVAPTTVADVAEQAAEPTTESAPKPAKKAATSKKK